MKIKKIIKLCKDSHKLALFADSTRKMKWLSDGYAIYPLQGCPIFDEDSFCNTYEINDSQRNKIVFRINEELPQGYDFSDTDNFESITEKMPLSVNYSSYDSVAFKTEFGVVFVKRSHLHPFDDYDSKDLSFMLRTNKSGQPYFAVKNGFMLIGIIEPLKVIDRTFCEELMNFTKQVEVTFYNGLEKKNTENAQIEMPEVNTDDEED